MKDRQESAWLASLFKAAGLPPDADLESVQAKMDALANRAAPLTRRWWKWILFVQGVAILIPLAWFRHPFFLPVSWVAVAALFTVLVFVFVNWWLRWRGMQKTWARSRLVTEVARSLLCTKHCPRLPALESLEVVPAIQTLRESAERSHTAVTSTEWKTDYLANRIDNQLEYFRSKQQEAERQRRQLSGWGTLMLDVALAFAFAGAVVTLSPEGASWRRMLGDYRFEIALGLAGIVAPLTLLLVQLLRGVQELNRRTARYAQQQRMLERARARLNAATTVEAAMKVVDETERQLLAEVLEWYFHAETAEHFFLRSEKEPDKETIAIGPSKEQSPFFHFLRRTLGITSAAGLFLLRVVLGRIPWIVGSGAAALMWIAYHQPSDQATRDQLKVLARLADSDGNDWIPNRDRLAHGCIIIVHGLHGDISWGGDTTKGWPKACAAKIAAVLGNRAPDVCVVDWHDAAQTAQHEHLDLGVHLWKQEDILTDLAGVRTQAEEVGNLLAFRLAAMIMDKSNPTILRDQPLHLIGHSAGGFIVARVAVLLKKFNVAPVPLHVTILDTPAPTPEITTVLPESYPAGSIDFYVSSLAGGRRETFFTANFSPKIHRQVVTPATTSSATKNLVRDVVVKVAHIGKEHSYAFEWYMQTIDDPGSAPDEGFNRSPWLTYNKTTGRQ
jgi:pimeloyl-ACP methyl ester carboxylesterase